MEDPEKLLYRQQFRSQDAVHGFLVLPGVARHIIDHPIFQRMRDIKQLGVTSYVYVGALHNRFSHSIGTGYLAMEVMKRLGGGAPELRFSVQDWVCVLTAALCHDLGHPAFSHMFEQFVRTRFPKWDHEDASRKLVKELWKDVCPLLESDLGTVFKDRDVVFIQEMIDPPKHQLLQSLDAGSLESDFPTFVKGRDSFKYACLFEIVSNFRGGLDVDRLDYFMRDSFHLGFTFPFNTVKYIDDLRLRQYEHRATLGATRSPERVSSLVEAHKATEKVWTIATSRKGKAELEYAIFDYRVQIYQRAYRHPAVCKVENHFVKAMRMLDGSIMNQARLDEKFDHRSYILLDDSYVTTAIKQNLAARAYFEQTVTRRNLMREVVGFPIDSSVDVDKALMKRYLLDFCVAKESPVAAEDLEENIIILVEKFHRGSKTCDPCDWLLFYACREDPSPLLGREISLEFGCDQDLSQRNMKQRVVVYFDPPLQQREEQLKYKYTVDEVNAFVALLREASEGYRQSVVPSVANGESRTPKRTHGIGANKDTTSADESRCLKERRIAAMSAAGS